MNQNPNKKNTKTTTMIEKQAPAAACNSNNIFPKGVYLFINKQFIYYKLFVYLKLFYLLNVLLLVYYISMGRSHRRPYSSSKP